MLAARSRGDLTGSFGPQPFGDSPTIVETQGLWGKLESVRRLQVRRNGASAAVLRRVRLEGKATWLSPRYELTGAKLWDGIRKGVGMMRAVVSARNNRKPSKCRWGLRPREG